VLDDPTPAGKFLGCNHECSGIWAPPMSRDQTLATKLVAEDEYDNYQEGAQTTENGVHKYDIKEGAHTYDAGMGAQTTKEGVHTYDTKEGVYTYDTNEGAQTTKEGVHKYDTKAGAQTTKEGAQITPGHIKYKQIKYDMSDFLGSSVRLCQDLTDTHNVPLKPALTPFVDETGDDYGLGAGLSEDAVDGAAEKDAHVDMERTLHELAENACVGLERSGYFTYGYNFDDVEDCHAAIYGDLDRRRLPYSENRMEGAVPLEFVRIPRVGRISVSATKSGVSKPTMTETLRTGLSLRSM
jgi:hypothetical protein